MKVSTAILLLLLAGCGENSQSDTTSNDSETSQSDTASSDSTGDNDDTETADAGAYCADDEQINPEQCGTVCDALDNQVDCENIVLPVPENYFAPPMGHACRWYTAYETAHHADGSCTIGDTINFCAYTLWDEDSCGGKSLPCGEDGALLEDSGAAITERNGRTFMVRDECPPQETSLWTRCSWSQLAENSPIFLDYGISETCECACELDIGG